MSQSIRISTDIAVNFEWAGSLYRNQTEALRAAIGDFLAPNPRDEATPAELINEVIASRWIAPLGDDVGVSIERATLVEVVDEVLEDSRAEDYSDDYNEDMDGDHASALESVFGPDDDGCDFGDMEECW
ncbi:MAG: hypothetical protein KKH12_15940 [Gammaproteobacteria bacterium]|nr:hypothetical protein [Gammaproteobacteria bacterium]